MGGEAGAPSWKSFGFYSVFSGRSLIRFKQGNNRSKGNNCVLIGDSYLRKVKVRGSILDKKFCII